MSKNIQKALDTSLANLQVSEKLRMKIVARKAPRRRQFHKPYSTAIAACLCILLSLSIVTATLPGLREMLFRRYAPGDSGFHSGTNRMTGAPSTASASSLSPHSSCTERGIQMEVLAFSVSEQGTLSMTLRLQDLEGGRLSDATQDLSLFLNNSAPLVTQSSRYDNKTRTYTATLTGKADPAAASYTLSMDAIPLGYQPLSDADRETWMEHIARPEESAILDLKESDPFFRSLSPHQEAGSIPLLAPGQMHAGIPGIDSPYVSNIGIMGSYLHVQLHCPRREAESDLSDQDKALLSQFGIANPVEYGFAVLANGKIATHEAYTNAAGDPAFSIPYREYLWGPASIEDLRELSRQLLDYLRFSQYLQGRWQVTLPNPNPRSTTQEASSEAASRAADDVDLRVRVRTTDEGSVGATPASYPGFGSLPQAFLHEADLGGFTVGSGSGFDHVLAFLFRKTPASCKLLYQTQEDDTLKPYPMDSDTEFTQPSQAGVYYFVLQVTWADDDVPFKEESLVFRVTVREDFGD